MPSRIQALLALVLYALLASARADSPSPQASLEKLTIKDVEDAAYTAPTATTATKSDIPIRDIPQAIEVRTRQMLDDLGGTQSSYEVAKTVAGVFNHENGQGDPGRNVPSFIFRGYYNSGYLKDGHMVNSWMSTIDMANIERVEFLKGPASVLYGGTTYAGDIGGVVNYVSKAPARGSIAATDITMGLDGFFRGTFDVGGATGDGQAVLWRLNGAAETGGSWREFADHDTQFVAPALSLQVSPDDLVTILADAVHTREIPERGLPLAPESFGIHPSKNFIDPGYTRTDIEAQNFDLRYDHRFSHRWAATLDVSRTRSRTGQYGAYLNYVPGGGSTLSGSHWKLAEDQAALDARVNGHFGTGPFDHDLLLGFNVTRGRYHADSEFGWGGPSIDVPGASLAQLDLPARGTLRSQYQVTPVDPGTFQWDSDTDAAYFQDLVTVAPTVKLLVGARRDHFTSNSIFGGSFGASVVPANGSHTSPRLGLIYEPFVSLSVYAVHATSFSPNSGLTLDGSRPPPDEGTLHEVGVKWAASGKLVVNLALYALRRKNMAFTDPSDPTGNAIVVAGETKSHGIELDLNGEIGSHLRLNVAASIMNGWISGGEPGGSLIVGQEFAAVPHRTLNLYAIYGFGGDAAWEFGGGPYYASEAWADGANTFKVPSTLQLDAVLSRRFGQRDHVQINVKNLTNRRNYTSNGWGWINPGVPASVFVMLRHEF